MLITRRKLPDQCGQIKPFQAIRFREQSNAVIEIEAINNSSNTLDLQPGGKVW